MKLIVKKGRTSLLLRVFIQDSSSTIGAGLSGLTSGSAGLVCYRARDDDGNAAATQLSLSGGTRGTWSSGGFVEKDATNQKGVYELGIDNAGIATGSESATYYLAGATNMAPCLLEIQLVAFDPQDSVRMGQTALPNAAAGANTGLPVVGTQVPNATAGAAGGMFIAGTNAATTVTTSFTTTFTGNLTGSVGSVTGAVGSVTGAVGSVTGAVGSVTGNVGGNVTGSVGSVVGAVGSVTGAVGSVTGNVGGNVVGSVASVTGNVGGNVVGSVASVTARVTANTDQINSNATAAATLATSLNTVATGTCAALGTTTSVISSALSPSGAVADQFKNRVLIFSDTTTTTALQGQATNITASTNAATPTFTVTALTTAPVNGDVFIIV